MLTIVGHLMHLKVLAVMCKVLAGLVQLTILREYLYNADTMERTLGNGSDTASNDVYTPFALIYSNKEKAQVT